MDAPHNIDPSAEFLKSVDDAEEDPEPAAAPDEGSMSPEEYRRAEKEFRLRQVLITTRKDTCKYLSRPSMVAF